jgi:ribosome-binding factor A
VAGVTVTAVEPAPDLTIAKVYVTTWPADPTRREEVLAGY